MSTRPSACVAPRSTQSHWPSSYAEVHRVSGRPSTTLDAARWAPRSEEAVAGRPRARSGESSTSTSRPLRRLQWTRRSSPAARSGASLCLPQGLGGEASHTGPSSASSPKPWRRSRYVLIPRTSRSFATSASSARFQRPLLKSMPRRSHPPRTRTRSEGSMPATSRKFGTAARRNVLSEPLGQARSMASSQCGSWPPPPGSTPGGDSQNRTASWKNSGLAKWPPPVMTLKRSSKPALAHLARMCGACLKKPSSSSVPYSMKSFGLRAELGTSSGSMRQKPAACVRPAWKTSGFRSASDNAMEPPSEQPATAMRVSSTA
mmetsp:Transcript_56116/g.175918  ORF Transcript_56116/g.175918 Transcript_56116/m.175918 type:complete len:318 (+) Transcript_56116:1847-2800(+)